jgi:hypothetical protein
VKKRIGQRGLQGHALIYNLIARILMLFCSPYLHNTMASRAPLPRFHFVDENDPEKRHKSRAHLARELHRMKRQRWKLDQSKPRTISRAHCQVDQFKWPLEVVIKAASPTVEIPSNLTTLVQSLLHHCMFSTKILDLSY